MPGHSSCAVRISSMAPCRLSLPGLTYTTYTQGCLSKANNNTMPTAINSLSRLFCAAAKGKSRFILASASHLCSLLNKIASFFSLGCILEEVLGLLIDGWHIISRHDKILQIPVIRLRNGALAVRMAATLPSICDLS